MRWAGPSVNLPDRWLCSRRMRLWRFLMWCRNMTYWTILCLPSAPRGVECGDSSDHCEPLLLVAPVRFFSAPESRRANESP